MAEAFVVSWEDKDYVVVPRERGHWQDVVADYLADDGDTPDLFPAYGLESRGSMLMLPVLVESVNGIPAENVGPVLSVVVFGQVMHRLYGDTDLCLNMQKAARSMTIISDGMGRIIESGDFPSPPLTWGKILDRIKQMPDIMKRLIELGDDAPAWVNDTAA